MNNIIYKVIEDTFKKEKRYRKSKFKPIEDIIKVDRKKIGRQNKRRGYNFEHRIVKRAEKLNIEACCLRQPLSGALPELCLDVVFRNKDTKEILARYEAKRRADGRGFRRFYKWLEEMNNKFGVAKYYNTYAIFFDTFLPIKFGKGDPSNLVLKDFSKYKYTTKVVDGWMNKARLEGANGLIVGMAYKRDMIVLIEQKEFNKVLNIDDE